MMGIPFLLFWKIHDGLSSGYVELDPQSQKNEKKAHPLTSRSLQETCSMIYE
jgi:hypothetical protein